MKLKAISLLKNKLVKQTENFINTKILYINYIVTNFRKNFKVNFINYLNKSTLPIRNLHFKLKQVDEEKLDKEYTRNLYEIFLDWSIEILQYGLVLSVILTYFGINFTFKSVICLGLLYWLVLNTLTKIKKIIGE